MGATSKPHVVVALLAVALTLAVPAANALADVHAFILIGGGNPGSFQDEEQTVFTNSALAVKRALIDGWGVSDLNTTIWYASSMGQDMFNDELGEFVTVLPSEDTLLFYYVGHGGSIDLVPNFAYGPNEVQYRVLNEALRRHAGEVVVVLDSCHSGSADNWLDGRFWLMTSCAADEVVPSNALVTNIPFQEGRGTPFSDSLATAILAGNGSVRTVFDTIGDDFIAFMRAGAFLGMGHPQLFYPHHGDLEMSASSRDSLCSQILRVYMAYREYHSASRSVPWLEANDASNASDHESAAAILKGSVTAALAARWQAEEAFIAALRALGYFTNNQPFQSGLTDLGLTDYIEDLESNSQEHRSVTEEEVRRSIALEEAWASGTPEWEGSDEFGDWFNATVTPVRLRYIELFRDEWVEEYGPGLRQLADQIGCQS